MKITIGITDDHTLFVKSLSALINNFENCSVITEASNGQELVSVLESSNKKPDILLIDVDMPVMNGVDTAKEISNKYPEIKLAALTMKEDDYTIINMIKAGCCAYLMKDIHPDELEKALIEINIKGYYNADVSNINYRRLIRKAHEEEFQITEKERVFLKLACSELTYKQIAAKMFLAQRTIDGYRESLFHKFNVESRVGMVLEGLRKKLLSL